MFSKLNNLKLRANSVIMCAMADAQTTQPVKPQSKAAVRAKKIVGVATTCAVAASLCAVTAFANADTQLSGSSLTFFQNALNVLKTVLILIGAGVGIWGIVNLLEGYGNDNPGAKSQGMKQLMAGIGVALVGVFAPDALGNLMGGTGGTTTTS